MVIRDLDVLRSPFGPTEADPVLLVDSNAVLACPIRLQRLKSVPWRDPQILERFRVVDQEELLPSTIDQVGRTDLPRCLRTDAVEDVLRPLISKLDRHTVTIAHALCYPPPLNPIRATEIRIRNTCITLGSTARPVTATNSFRAGRDVAAFAGGLMVSPGQANFRNEPTLLRSNRDRPGDRAADPGVAAIYILWGSTYLAIRFAIETLPPFLMAGTRFLVAGGLLSLWARSRGVALPNRAQMRHAAVVGVLLLLMGNGAVVWAEQWVPSGLAALIISTVPLWMVALDWLWGGGAQPKPGVWAALLVGLGGVALLAGDTGIGGAGREGLIGAGVIVFGTLSWSVGSIYSRRAKLPVGPRMAAAIQMLAGGTALMITGTAVGEWADFDPGSVSLVSGLALLYLIVAGSLVAFSAYIWLLQVTTPARVATYAYVNPVVALFLGWWLADEPVGPRTFGAAGLILASVLALSYVSTGKRALLATPPARRVI